MQTRDKRSSQRERRAAVVIKAAEDGKTIRKAHRSFANYKAKMVALRRPDGTVRAFGKAMEKIIHDHHSDLSNMGKW
uniref:Transposase n=1 Tax=Angiostrongylus cantonensis TaxID=6313 RepID=A0A0K0DM26_ANGCA